MGIKEVVTAARSPWQNAYVVRPNLSGWLYSCDGSGVEGCSVPQLCPPNTMLPIAPL
jgi:hypothetical protein